MSEAVRDCTTCKYRWSSNGPCEGCADLNWEPRPVPAAMSYTARILEARRLCETEENLAQLAEEAAELAQAALKLRRALGHGIPTGETLNGCWAALREEWADVNVCMDVLGLAADGMTVEVFKKIKSIKMLERLRKRDAG